MSLADTIFIKNCKEILFNGTSDEIAKVRPTWEGWHTSPYHKEIWDCEHL